MRTVHRVAELQAELAEWRARGESIALVPTMGNLHGGHLSLVQRARQLGECVVVSIFVNPLQFGPGEDFQRYPRPLERDRELLAGIGVDLLWLPRAQDLYPPDHRTRVRVTGLDDVLEGASRPGHFEGVATVVAMLLNAVRPDVLWLGQKDAQQALVLERMCLDLLEPVEVRRAPTVREPDGLALSSRNAYLSPEERRQALALWKGLEAARDMLEHGERSAARVEQRIREVWRRYPLVREDLIAVVDARTLERVADAQAGRKLLIMLAAHVGATRLIDNLEWTPR